MRPCCISLGAESGRERRLTGLMPGWSADKGTRVQQRWQPPGASLNTLAVWELTPGLLSCLKYLRDIYTPVQNEVEVKQTEKTLESELTGH